MASVNFTDFERARATRRFEPAGLFESRTLARCPEFQVAAIYVRSRQSMTLEGQSACIAADVKGRMTVSHGYGNAVQRLPGQFVLMPASIQAVLMVEPQT